MSKFYSQYLNNQINFKAKWIEYYSLPPSFNGENFREGLTPLNNDKEFLKLTIEQRKKFFLEYIKFIAEALVFFEQLLVFGSSKILKKKLNISEETNQSLKQFLVEELYHSAGYRHFLHIHSDFDWKNKKIYADARVLRKLITAIVNFSPAAVFLPGAKLEAFTLSYHKMISKHYPNNRENSWSHLNQIHQLDEAYHLPLEFELHNSIIEIEGPVKTIIGGILFVFVMQIALFLGSFRVISFSFEDFSFFKKLNWTLKMAKWAVRTMPAYKEARTMTRNMFLTKKPNYGKWMSFIYW
jgi:hypothetical protein